MHSLETLGAPLQSLGKLQIMGALFQTLGALLTILGEPPPPGRINTIKTLSKMIVLKSIRNGVFTKLWEHCSRPWESLPQSLCRYIRNDYSSIKQFDICNKISLQKNSNTGYYIKQYGGTYCH